MKKYRVSITETLIKTVEVNAEDMAEAQNKVENDYYYGRIILDADNFSHTEFQCEEVKEDNIIRNAVGQIIRFNKPTQVKFWDSYENEDGDGDWVGGIGVDDYIICGCCGSTMDLAELYENAAHDNIDCNDAIKVFPNWLNIKDEIIGE